MRLSRRTLLSGVISTAAGAILVACGSDAATTTPPTVSTAATTVAVIPTVAVTIAATPAATSAPAATAAPTTAPASVGASVAPAAISGVASATSAAGGLAEVTAVSMITGLQAPNLVGKLTGLKSLHLALLPTEDTSGAFAANQAVLAYLKQALGVGVTGVVAGSYTTEITAMGAKKVDVATFGAFEYILAHEAANAQARVSARKADGTPTSYRSLIIAPVDSPITTLADLKGKSFSFVDPASTSGHLVPSYTILTRTGLKETDYKPTYAGSHPASFQAVANKKVEAGAVADVIFAQAPAADKSKVKIVDTSFDIPYGPITVRGDIAMGDQEVLRQALIGINDQPRDSTIWTKFVQSGQGASATTLVPADDHDYDEVRKIPPAIGVDIKSIVK